MKTLSDRLNFHPRRLTRVASVVRDEHPLERAFTLASTESGRIAELIDDVLARKSDSRALRLLGSKLSRSDLRGLLYSVGSVPALAVPLQHLLPDYAFRGMGRDCWRAVEATPTLKPLWALFRRVLEHGGLRGWVSDQWTPILEEAAGGDDPVRQLVATFDRLRLAVAEVSQRGTSPFKPDTPLLRDVGMMRQVLSQGAALSLDPIGSRIEWWTRLSPEDRVTAGRHFLTSVPSSAWQAQILEEIEDSFGIPGTDGSRPAFWEPVDSEIRQAFRRHFLAKRLDEALKGDTERHAYWRRWLDDLKDIRVSGAGGVEFAAMDFGGFGVIEFFEKGNAAYFYSAEDLDRIEDAQARHVRDLKRRRNYEVSRGWGRRKFTQNRLIHSGGWYSTADRMIRAYGEHFRG